MPGPLGYGDVASSAGVEPAKVVSLPGVEPGQRASEARAEIRSDRESKVQPRLTHGAKPLPWWCDLRWMWSPHLKPEVLFSNLFGPRNEQGPTQTSPKRCLPRLPETNPR